MGHEDFVLEYNGTDYLIGHSGRIFRTRDEKDMVRLLFGPHKSDEFNSFDIETKQILEKALPIPLWVWGWDSV